jgi:sucrose-6-phosphate hydrolase SacC (GH32 family)
VGSTDAIVSGVPWYDTDGNRIEAHGGGFLLVGDTYYWYGESAKVDDATQHGINCYSSTDLYNWKFEGMILSQQDLKGLPVGGPYIVERPKVVYNQKTGLYVLWFHLDTNNYSLRYAGIGTSPTPSGHFTFLRGFQPDGHPSLDQTLFQDGDVVYHIRSVDNQYLGVSKLTDDYLNTTGIISRTQEAREGPAAFKYNNMYYIISSHLSGWDPNEMDMFEGPSMNGPWTSLGNPTADATSFNSQSTDVLIYRGTIIYQGDRWNYSGPGGLLNATYIWLPVLPAGSSFKIPWTPSWQLPSN